MPVSDHALIHAWNQVLTLSKLEAGQGVTILTSAATHPQTLRCATIAAQGLGAIVNRLDLPPVNGELALSRDPLAYLGTTPLTGNRAAIAALKESDLVLDLMTLLFSPEQHEILASGTKILLAVEPPEILVRLVPTEADRERVKAATARMARAREMHITSAAGTDLRCALGEFPAIAEYGYCDEPGRWDHWPSGFALTWANERQSQGRIVLDKGDILLPQKRYLTEPVTLTVRGGLLHRDRGRDGSGLAGRLHGRVQRPGSVRHVAHWLGLAAAGALVGAGPVRPRANHRDGCAGLRGQLPVLAGPEQ